MRFGHVSDDSVDQGFPGVRQFFDRDGFRCHPLESTAKLGLDGLSFRCEHFERRPVVAEQIDEEGSA